ncbi:unnamed protein product [Acanthosepion pharaonis]|uniref:Uncharacterized protein n=1 Tax=Acanthosepion pharaonis TaxID=158019 RepID=A0A812DGU3_ACAPH|nr:unnamed protein product [Sepia pharaonis]
MTQFFPFNSICITSIFSSVSHHLIQEPFPLVPIIYSQFFFPPFATIVFFQFPPLDPTTFCPPFNLFSHFSFLTSACHKCISSVSHHLIQEPFSFPITFDTILPPFHSLHLPATSVFSSVSHHLIQEPFPCSPTTFDTILSLLIPYICLPQSPPFMTQFSPFHSLHLPATSAFSSVSHHLIQEPFPCSPYHFCHKCFPFSFLTSACHNCIFLSCPHHLIHAPFPCSPYHFCHNVFLFHSLHLPATIVFSSVSHHLIQVPFPCSPNDFCHNVFLFISLHLPATSVFSSVPHHFCHNSFLFIPYICLPQLYFSSVSHHLIQEPFPCSPYHFSFHNFFPFHSLHLPATIFVPPLDPRTFFLVVPSLLTQCFPFSFLTSACHKCIFLSVPPLDPSTFFLVVPTTFVTMFSLFSLHLHLLSVPPLDPTPFSFLSVPMFSLFIPYICLPPFPQLSACPYPATSALSSVSHHLIQAPFLVVPNTFVHNFSPFHSLHLPATIVFFLSVPPLDPRTFSL